MNQLIKVWRSAQARGFAVLDTAFSLVPTTGRYAVANPRGERGALSGMVAGIVGLAIGVFILAALIGPAITALFGVDTTTWDDATIALFSVIALVCVVAVIWFILKSAGLVDSN